MVIDLGVRSFVLGGTQVIFCAQARDPEQAELVEYEVSCDAFAWRALQKRTLLCVATSYV